MKKQYKLQLAVLCLFVIALFATGCRNASSNHGLDMDSIVYDSLMDSNLECKITIDYPKDNDSLAMGVKRFIASELASHYLPLNNSDEESETNKYPVYSGNVDDGQQLVNYYGNGVMTYLAEMREEWKEYASKGTPVPTLSQEIKIVVKEITSDYITYSVTDDNYLGGAHRSFTHYCRNISTKTNKPVDNILDTRKLSSMQHILRMYVLQGLQASGIENVSDSTMDNFVILPDDGLIPLPAFSPWIENDSLHFIYQPYEIASYAVGQIKFNVAVKDMKPYFTKDADNLVK